MNWIIEHNGHRLCLYRKSSGAFGLVVPWDAPGWLEEINPLYAVALQSPSCTEEIAQSITLSILEEKFPE